MNTANNNFFISHLLQNGYDIRIIPDDNRSEYPILAGQRFLLRMNMLTDRDKCM